MTCSIPGCGRPIHGRGLCNAHLRRLRKYGDPLIRRKLANGTAPDRCSIAGCERPYHGKGLCGLHAGRLRYHGDPLAGGPTRVLGDDVARFWSKVDRSGRCWLWTGYTAGGYGRFLVDGFTTAAHRFAYELLVGPITEGLDLDHMCHNADPTCPGGPCLHRSCVNPEHLIPATRSENMLRAFSRTGPAGLAS